MGALPLHAANALTKGRLMEALLLPPANVPKLHRVERLHQEEHLYRGERDERLDQMEKEAPRERHGTKHARCLLLCLLTRLCI